MFQREIDGLFQGLPNVPGIAYDILIAGFDDMCRDHVRCYTWQGAKDMQTGQPKVQQGQVPIQVYKHPIQIISWSIVRSKKNAGTGGHATA